jgi:hypothetical protein
VIPRGTLAMKNLVMIVAGLALLAVLWPLVKALIGLSIWVVQVAVLLAVIVFVIGLVRRLMRV